MGFSLYKCYNKGLILNILPHGFFMGFSLYKCYNKGLILNILPHGFFSV